MPFFQTHVLPDTQSRSAPVRTKALRLALAGLRDHTAIADLRLLERWELEAEPGVAAALRVRQIRRANPSLAARIRAEIAQQEQKHRALPHSLPG